MEYCQLGDLSYFIKKREDFARNAYTADMFRHYPNPPGGGLNEVIVRHFLKQLASALEFLRNKNLIHRDVKPQNLLLIPSPQRQSKSRVETTPHLSTEKYVIPVAGVESFPLLKLADFGFARSLPSTSLAETLCGSPLYMAPEILRYEKYDAKADLWSVGTVLYESVTSKPPFRAANHVDLLRKIETSGDKIHYPDYVVISDQLKSLMKGLLRRSPVERMSFTDFFDNAIVKGEIPGLKEEHRQAKRLEEEPESSTAQSSDHRRSSSRDSGPAIRHEEHESRKEPSPGPRDMPFARQSRPASRTDSVSPRRGSRLPPRPTISQRRGTEQVPSTDPPHESAQDRSPKVCRPSMVSHATAPARPDLYAVDAKKTTSAPMQRQRSKNSSSPSSTVPGEVYQEREVTPQRKGKNVLEDREARERAAQDVAFERDYVVVEKRSVEVNAFADELAASPKIHGTNQNQQNQNQGAMVRRATTQVAPTATAGAQVAPSRALQLASGKRPDQMHHRQSSYERRYRSSSSTSSAISKAINMASGRLLNMGFSPPLGIGRGGPSPPAYNPFPAYPTSQSSLIMIGDGSKGTIPLDEDKQAVHIMEESATRSDVVYGFAEVKYKQLIPLAPSMDHGLGLHQAGIPEKDESDAAADEDGGLTIDATVTLSEEALVLYVKALALLAHSMDIAGFWWARKSRAEIIDDSGVSRSPPNNAGNTAVGNRVNNVVQWVRSRFNEVLEKAEFVRLKLIEAQKKLPLDHQSHPNNYSSSSYLASMGSSVENVRVSPGVTAEKLMYDRALEMSRSAAVNELVGEDLPGCEMAYVTAVRMLEAILEDEEDPSFKDAALTERDANNSSTEASTDLVGAEDRQVVLKCKSSISSPGLSGANFFVVAQSIRHRLAALRKKLQMIAKRQSGTHTHIAPSKPLVAATQAPAVAGTPPL